MEVLSLCSPFTTSVHPCIHTALSSFLELGMNWWHNAPYQMSYSKSRHLVRWVMSPILLLESLTISVSLLFHLHFVIRLSSSTKKKKKTVMVWILWFLIIVLLAFYMMHRNPRTLTYSQNAYLTLKAFHSAWYIANFLNEWTNEWTIKVFHLAEVHFYIKL